jgi:hypothetical protein
MDAQNIEKLNQLISRSDMTGNEKVQWLIAFTENYQALQLLQPNVSSSAEPTIYGTTYHKDGTVTLPKGYEGVDG